MKKFTYNYDFVPIAATVIYSIGLGLPLILKVMMRFLGSQFFNGTFIEVSEGKFYHNVDNWDIRLLFHIVLSDRIAMWGRPYKLVLMGTSRVLNSDIFIILGYRLLERA